MSVRVSVNGKTYEAQEDQSLAAFMLNNGITDFRRSVDGSARAPVCGMGICFDCRVRIGATSHVRACLVKVEEGMEVHTDL